MRWPFGPPHLTLKPSKKTKHKKKQNKKQHKKTQKETKTKKEKVKNTKIPQKELFSYQSKFSFFLTGYPKIAFFLAPWPRKRAPQNTIKIGVPACFFWGERSYASRNGHFWTKNPNSEIPVIIFFLAFFSFSKTKNTKIC